MRDYFIEHIITPLADAPMIDGVFFDCFNYAYVLPTPWNRHAVNIPNCTTAGGDGCEALLEGTIDLARRIALKLNARGKVPMFSNPASFANTAKAPIWLDEARLLAGLNGTQFQFNYEFMRAEKLASNGQLANMLQVCSRIARQHASARSHAALESWVLHRRHHATALRRSHGWACRWACMCTTPTRPRTPRRTSPPSC